MQIKLTRALALILKVTVFESGKRPINAKTRFNFLKIWQMV